ncbi:hypothetical protein SAMN05660745_01829 [Corynebacterium glucuronolyticum]|nr:hypothetical protein CGLUCO_00010 [Corynebacterium glucuronolyticum DSM 44120]SMB86996.1 hypothetical protein SAMN05660745_01829 [Corynebacterium glucuronolyticum]
METGDNYKFWPVASRVGDVSAVVECLWITSVDLWITFWGSELSTIYPQAGSELSTAETRRL